MNDQKNIMKFGKKLKLLLKKNLIANLHKMKKLKAKIKSYNGKINTNFHNNKIQKKDSRFICLSVILINSFFRTGKTYYHQVFLEELEYIADDIDIYSDSYREDHDEETSNEEKNSGEENFDEENQGQNVHTFIFEVF